MRTGLWLCVMRKCTDSGGMSQMHMVGCGLAGRLKQREQGRRTCGTVASFGGPLEAMRDQKGSRCRLEATEASVLHHGMVESDDDSGAPAMKSLWGALCRHVKRQEQVALARRTMAHACTKTANTPSTAPPLPYPRLSTSVPANTKAPSTRADVDGGTLSLLSHRVLAVENGPNLTHACASPFWSRPAASLR